jgi:hypothetical protein
MLQWMPMPQVQEDQQQQSLLEDVRDSAKKAVNEVVVERLDEALAGEAIEIIEDRWSLFLFITVIVHRLSPSQCSHWQQNILITCQKKAHGFEL